MAGRLNVQALDAFWTTFLTRKIRNSLAHCWWTWLQKKKSWNTWLSSWQLMISSSSLQSPEVAKKWKEALLPGLDITANILSRRCLNELQYKASFIPKEIFRYKIPDWYLGSDQVWDLVRCTCLRSLSAPNFNGFLAKWTYLGIQ